MTPADSSERRSGSAAGGKKKKRKEKKTGGRGKSHGGREGDENYNNHKAPVPLFPMQRLTDAPPPPPAGQDEDMDI